MEILNFKKWFTEIFGQGIEPPVQDPSKLNNGAFPRYEIPDEKYPLFLPKKKTRLRGKRVLPPQGDDEIPQF